MQTVKVLDYISVEDYLEGEKTALIKHEYVYGQIYAMAGASDSHNSIALNIASMLNEISFKHFCRTYISDMKVRAEEVFYYPDVMVVCAQDNSDDYYKEKPCFIAEVLSKSTERIDKHEKLQAYLAIPSLQTYLMVDSKQKFIKGYHRSGNNWEERTYQEQDEVSIDCLATMLSVESIYRGLNL